jgi:hypothetical protein
LAVSERQVATRVDTAQRFARHTGVRDVVEQGRVQVWTATKLVEYLDELAPLVTPDQLRAVGTGALLPRTDAAVAHLVQGKGYSQPH